MKIAVIILDPTLFQLKNEAGTLQPNLL